MSKRKRLNKSKLDWVYAHVIEDKFVNPEDIVVLHSPIEPLLTCIGDSKQPVLHLRTCAEGRDEKGNALHFLYCTENNNRFFDQQEDGWHEQKPSYRPDRPSKKCGGAHNYMDMINFGEIACHLLIAHAWVENRYNYIVEVWNEKKGKSEKVCTRQVDHRDTNTLNNNADNLEYVTAAENMRRRKITNHLKNKAGIDSKRLTPLLMRGIFSLPEGSIPMLVEQYLKICANDKSQMLVENIRINIANALDAMK
ncbi:MAG: HNH endonuclease [Paludibacteraceae bacterium]|nr:HNH endonuclease [Paludibacteraceae bacterium]